MHSLGLVGWYFSWWRMFSNIIVANAIQLFATSQKQYSYPIYHNLFTSLPSTFLKFKNIVKHKLTYILYIISSSVTCNTIILLWKLETMNTTGLSVFRGIHLTCCMIGRTLFPLWHTPFNTRSVIGPYHIEYVMSNEHTQLKFDLYVPLLWDCPIRG